MLNAALEMAQHYRNSVANSDLRTRRRELHHNNTQRLAVLRHHDASMRACQNPTVACDRGLWSLLWCSSQLLQHALLAWRQAFAS
jgi:hypothetical protein